MTSLGQLRSQKTTVLQGMDNSRSMISDAGDKVTRLQNASSELATIISELETTKSSINNLTIDNGSWKGQKENKFEENYSEYSDSVKDYISKAEDAKETIDADIKKYEAQKANYTTGLNNLEDTLDSLEAQISQAEKG